MVFTIPCDLRAQGRKLDTVVQRSAHEIAARWRGTRGIGIALPRALICAYCFNEIRPADGVCLWCGEAPKALPPVRIRKPPIRSAAPPADLNELPDVIVPRLFLGLWGFGIGLLGLLAFEWLPAVTFVTLAYAGLGIVSAVFVGREAWAWWTSMVVLAAPFVLSMGGALLAAGELRGEGCGCALLILFVIGVMTLLPMGVLWKNRPEAMGL